MLHAIQHLFHEFLFAYLFFLPNTDVTAVFCLLHYSFLSFVKINFWQALNNAQLTHPLTSGFHESKHAYAEGGHFKHMT